MPLRSVHLTLCIYIFLSLVHFARVFFGNMSNLFLFWEVGAISIFLGEYIFLLILFTVLYQGGRSCAGARVAPAEKFGLGQKF